VLKMLLRYPHFIQFKNFLNKMILSYFDPEVSFSVGASE
jgi:hypothetical protein